MHRLTREEARRIAVRAQLLDLPRPTDLLAVVGRLTFLQIDPTAAVAPSADLVLWSRLGSSYRSAELTEALEAQRALFELDAMIRPIGDLGLHLPIGNRDAASRSGLHPAVIGEARRSSSLVPAKARLSKRAFVLFDRRLARRGRAGA